MSEAWEPLPVRLGRLRSVIGEAAVRAGRSPEEVTLVAVSKTVPIELLEEAVAAGQHVFGENRVQEGVTKAVMLAEKLPGISWHLIGHLQTNKIRPAVQTFSLLESLDRQKLAARLDEEGRRVGRRLPVLLQVNVAEEPTKTGFTVDDARSSLPALAELAALDLRGLMTMAPPAEDPEEVRWVFRSLRELRDELRERSGLEGLRELSMGMSGDFEVAIEEGATMVRIGRALFGERPTDRGAILRDRDPSNVH